MKTRLIRRQSWARCGACGHVWPFCTTPMKFFLFLVMLRHLTCPRCQADTQQLHPATEPEAA